MHPEADTSGKTQTELAHDQIAASGFSNRLRWTQHGCDQASRSSALDENPTGLQLRCVMRELRPVIDPGQDQYDIGRKLRAVGTAVSERTETPLLDLGCQGGRPVRRTAQ